MSVRVYLSLCFVFMMTGSLGAMWDKQQRNAYAFPEYKPETEFEGVPEDQPYIGMDQCGGCGELYVHYEPCCYKTCRYVQDYITVRKNCLRYVDKFYEVTRHRYVPQYYTVIIRQREPEWYPVEEARPYFRKVEEDCYCYEPQYYWKPICQEPCCDFIYDGSPYCEPWY